MSLLGVEVHDKKQLTRGSYHRVNGSRSKKCTLPSDVLSSAQKQKLNGEVFTMNLNRPMDYSEFSHLPYDLQREYIESLREKYGAGKIHIRTMLGIGQLTMDKLCERLNITGFLGGSAGKMPKEFKPLWESFLRSGSVSAPSKEPPCNSEPAESQNFPRIRLQNGRLTYSGQVSAICNSLLAVFGPDTELESLAVTFQVAPGLETDTGDAPLSVEG